MPRPNSDTFAQYRRIIDPFIEQLNVSAELKRTRRLPEWRSHRLPICKGSSRSRALPSLAIARLYAGKRQAVPHSLSVSQVSLSASLVLENIDCSLSFGDYTTSRCQSIGTDDIKRREHLRDAPGVNYFEKICLRRGNFQDSLHVIHC